MTPTSARSRMATPDRIPASPSLHARTDAARQAPNPLLEAARPLLEALADTPAKLGNSAVAERHKWLESEVRMFEKVCADLRLCPDHVRNARYCLCSAIDEAAMQTDWGKGVTTGAEWSSKGLAVAFAQDRQGADRVFRIIEQCLAHPYENLDLLDVIQNILDLGFKGRYRFEADGQKKLSMVRQLVHDAVTGGLSDSLGLGSRPIAPGARLPGSRWRMRVQTLHPLQRWQVDPWVRPLAATRRTYPWITVGLLCVALLCLGGYAVYVRSIATARAQQLVRPLDALAIRLNNRLKSEIAAGALSVEENVQHTALTLRFGGMFPPGEPAINAWMKPMIATVGEEIASTAAKAQVTGYTDSLPVGRSTLASNQALSEERANQVMQILQAAGVPSEHLSVAGKGDADPVAGNETPEGRMKNRRVEIVVSE